jgi:hypothetical protein
VTVIDFDDELGVSKPDDPDDIIDHLFDATEGIATGSGPTVATAI